MWPRRIRPTQINHIALRVRDLQRSAAFYCELFGLELRPAVPPGDSVCVCAAPSASSLLSFGIALIQGLPRGSDPLGMDHLSLEVRTAEDLEDIFVAAAARGAQATEPRIYGGYYQTFIFDPDGYKVEVVSTDLPPETAGKNGKSHRAHSLRRPNAQGPAACPADPPRTNGNAQRTEDMNP